MGWEGKLSKGKRNAAMCRGLGLGLRAPETSGEKQWCLTHCIVHQSQRETYSPDLLYQLTTSKCWCVCSITLCGDLS